MKREKIMSNLEFSVKLKAMTDGFNKGIQQAGSTFGGFQTKLNHAMQAIEDNAQTADKAIESLFNELSDTPLPQAMQKVSAELSQMGTGAILAEGDVKRAMGLISSHIDGLNDDLKTAEKNMQGLKDADIVNTQKLSQARNSVKTLTDEFNQSNKETEKLNKELEKARDKLNGLENAEIIGGENAEEAKRYIADLEIGIREATARVSWLEKQINSAKDKTKSLSDGFKETNKETTQLNRALKKAESSLEKLEKKQVVDSDKVAEANANIAKLKQEIEQSTNKAEKFSKQINSAKDKTKSLSLEFRDSKKEVTSLNTTLKKTKNSLEKLESKGVVNSEKVAEAKREFSGLESKLLESSRATEYFSEEVDNANEAVKKLSKQKFINDSALKEATDDVKTLSDEIRNASRASDNFEEQTSKAMKRAEQSAESARNAIFDMLGVRTDSTIKAEIEQINHAMSDLSNRTDLSKEEIQRMAKVGKQRLAQLNNELRNVSGEVNKLGDESQASGKKMHASFDGVKTALLSLPAMLATAGVGIGVAEIIQTADAFKDLEARIKLATGEGKAFETGFAGVKQIANETFSSIEDTGTLFARITQASETLEMSQQDLLGVTRTINQSIQLSGGSAESADQAITQLIQGLQSGVLRGEEFNSVMEQAPRLASVLADSLGVTKGELRAMAEEGKLSSEVVINAVKEQSAVVQAEFEKMPVTVRRSLTVLKNKIFEVVGEMDGMFNQSSRIAEGIQYITEALDNVDPATMKALAQIFDQLITMVSELAGLVIGTYNSISDLSNAFDGVAENGKKVGLITKLMQELAINIGYVSDGIKGISIVADSVIGSMSILVGGLVSGLSKIPGLSDEARLSMESLGDALMAKGDELHLRSEQQMMEFKSSAQQARDEFAKANEEAMKSYEDMTTKAFDTFADIVLVSKTSSKEIAKSFSEALSGTYTKEGVDELIAGMYALQERGRITGEQMAQAMNKATRKYKELEDQTERDIEAIAKMASESRKANDGMISAEAKHEASLKGLAVSISEGGGVYVSTMGESTLSTEQLNKALKKATKASGELAQEVGYGLSKGYTDLKTKVEKLIEDWDLLGDSGQKSGALLEQSLITMTEKAKNTQELKDVIAIWKEMGEQGKLSGEDLSAGLELASGKLDGLTDGVNSVNEAYKLMGLITKEQLAEQAESYRQSYELIANDGNATARQLAEAFKKYARSAVSANGDVVDSTLDAQAKQHGLAISVDETGRVTFDSMKEASYAIDGVSYALSGVSNASEKAGQSLVNSAHAGMEYWDKLAQKVKETKNEEAKAKAERKERKVRSSTNQFNNRSGIESFLRANGLSEEQAVKEAQRIYRNNADRNGNINWTRLNGGYQDGQMMTLNDLEQYKSPSAVLMEIVEKIKYAEKGSLGMEAIRDISSNQQPNKTINVNLSANNSPPVNANIPANQEELFMNFIKKLQESKMMSGRA